jgi:hypothetical protein
MFIANKHHNYSREVADFLVNVTSVWPSWFANVVIGNMVQEG